MHFTNLHAPDKYRVRCFVADERITNPSHCRHVSYRDGRAAYLIRDVVGTTEAVQAADELIPKLLLLDFEHVPFFGSDFLSELLLLQGNQRCHPILCNLSPEIDEVFQITRLNRVFEIQNKSD